MSPTQPRWRHPVALRLALIAGLLFTGTRMVAPEVFHFSAGDLAIRLSPSVPGGDVVLRLGPFGDLSWQTHKGPLDVEASFRLGPTGGSLPQLDELRDLRLSYTLRKIPWILLFGAFLGLLVAEGWGMRRWRAAAISTPAFTAGVALLVGVSALTFNPRALADPQYRGPVKDAPRILQLLQEAQGDFSGLRKNINKMAAGLQRIHAQVVGSTPARSTDTLKLLVVSDLHNNPIGLLIAEGLVEQFGVGGILDAGDFTDRGTTLEGELFSRFASLGIPHIIAPGNHEDSAALAVVRKLDGVTILGGENDTANIDGVTILGAEDPNSDSIESNPFNEAADTEVPITCARLEGRFADVRPQIILVHDPRLGSCAAKLAEEQQVPLVYVWGHLHRQSYEEKGSVVSVSPGTSGANGIKTPKIAPYGFALLEFDRTSDRLSSVCLFNFDAPQALRDAACHLAPTASG